MNKQELLVLPCTDGENHDPLLLLQTIHSMVPLGSDCARESSVVAASELQVRYYTARCSRRLAAAPIAGLSTTKLEKTAQILPASVLRSVLFCRILLGLVSKASTQHLQLPKFPVDLLSVMKLTAPSLQGTLQIEKSDLWAQIQNETNSLNKGCFVFYCSGNGSQICLQQRFNEHLSLPFHIWEILLPLSISFLCLGDLIGPGGKDDN